MEEPDPAVIRAAARGDLGALEQLVRAYQPLVWRFLRHLVHDDALAEDLTQETFVRMYRRIGSFRFRARFSTWLFSVARNAAIDALRARDRRRALAEQLPPPRAQADASERVALEDALRRLELPLREAFVLIEVFGLPYAEAGRTLGVPEGTVKSRVFRARRELVARLTEREGGAASAL